MPSAVRISRSTANGVTKVSLSGRITEDADLNDARPTQPGRLVFDLGDLKAINSCGVREWVKFIQRIPEQVEVVYERCPSAMVAQANMIAHFLGRGRVSSVLAPYYCDSCGNGVEVLLQIGKDLMPGARTPPPRGCPTCKTPMAFDDVDGYFDFLNKK